MLKLRCKGQDKIFEESVRINDEDDDERCGCYFDILLFHGWCDELYAKVSHKMVIDL